MSQSSGRFQARYERVRWWTLHAWRFHAQLCHAWITDAWSPIECNGEALMQPSSKHWMEEKKMKSMMERLMKVKLCTKDDRWSSKEVAYQNPMEQMQMNLRCIRMTVRLATCNVLKSNYSNRCRNWKSKVVMNEEDGARWSHKQYQNAVTKDRKQTRSLSDCNKLDAKQIQNMWPDRHR